MKRQFISIVLASILSISIGCKKDKGKNYSRFPVPEWKVDETGKYPYSMTAVVKVPDEIKTGISAGDKLGAFVNDECRGLGVQVNVNGSIVFYVLIRGTASEQSKIQFQFYDSGSEFLYKTDNFIDYVVDGNYGTADNPASPDLVQAE